MDLRLQDQTVLVAGGGRGIGRAAAEAFAREGCRVAIWDLRPDSPPAPSPDAAEKTWRECRVDVTRETEVNEHFARLWEEWGGVDHLVNATGAGSGKSGFPFWNLEPGDWGRVLEVNLMGAVHLAHAFAPRAAERGSGTLLFFSSVAGQIGSQTDPPYSAAKAALINFTQCAARDLAPRGVRVNAIAPGMVQTELNQSVWAAAQKVLPESERRSYEAWGREKVERVAPLGRWQEASEIAALAVFLASPHAANITGQVLNVDGGQVMRG